MNPGPRRSASSSSSSSSPYRTPFATPCPSPSNSLNSTRMDFSEKDISSSASFQDEVDEFSQLRSHHSTPSIADSICTLKALESKHPAGGPVAKDGGNLNDEPVKVAHDPQTHNCVTLNVVEQKLSELRDDGMKIAILEQNLTKVQHQLREIHESYDKKINELQRITKGLIITEAQAYEAQLSSIETKPDINMNSYDTSTQDEISSHKSMSPQLTIKLTESLKYKLRSLPAMVKGYLTRRLLQTERVSEIIKTIIDTTRILEEYEPSKTLKFEEQIEEVNFHSRLISQLNKSCHEFHKIFFGYSKAQQMNLISMSREWILECNRRSFSVLSTRTLPEHQRTSIREEKKKKTSIKFKREKPKVLTKKTKSEQSSQSKVNSKYAIKTRSHQK